MRVILYLAAAAVLVGCAAPRQKPVMGNEDYKFFATHEIAIDRCGRTGLLDPGIAAFGRDYLRNAQGTWSYSPSRYEQAITHAKRYEYPQSVCNSVAMNIHSWKQSTDERREASAVMMQMDRIDRGYSRPSVQTHCNRVGNQVLCNSY